MKHPTNSKMELPIIHLNRLNESIDGEPIDFGQITPLTEKLKPQFVDAIRQLTRPYLSISQTEYDKLMRLTDGLGDVVLYRNIKMTFGNADGGWALMPLINDYQEYVVLI